jgi:hypothetical protein
MVATLDMPVGEAVIALRAIAGHRSLRYDRGAGGELLTGTRRWAGAESRTEGLLKYL